MSQMKQYYDKKIRILETSDFIDWFESWYGTEEEFKNYDDLHDGYLSERRFALFGWMARNTPSHIRNDKDVFLKYLTNR